MQKCHGRKEAGILKAARRMGRPNPSGNHAPCMTLASTRPAAGVTLRENCNAYCQLLLWRERLLLTDPQSTDASSRKGR